MKRLLQLFVKSPAPYRDIFIIVIAYAIFSIGGSLYWAAIPILTEETFYFSSFATGAVMAGIGVVYILTDGPIGIILDYIGYKKGAAIATLFAVVTALLAISHPTLPVFLLGIFFFALSWNILTQATSAYVLYSVPGHDEGKVFGLYGSLYRFGLFVATLFIGRVAAWGFEVTGWFFLIPTLLAFVLIAGMLKAEQRKYDHHLWHALVTYWRSASEWRRGWQAMHEFSPISWVAALDGFAGATFSAAIWFVIPLSLSSFANPFLPEGFALGAFEIAGIFAVAVGGFLADHYSKKKLFLRLLALAALTTLALGFVSAFLAFVVLAFFTMVFRDAISPALESLLAMVDRKHDKDGTIWGALGILIDAGYVVGPIAGGAIFGVFGLRGVFIFLALLLAVDWCCARVLLKNFSEERGLRLWLGKHFHLGGLLRHHSK